MRVERDAGLCRGSFIVSRGVTYIVRYLTSTDRTGKVEFLCCARIDAGNVVVGEGHYFEFGDEVDTIFPGPVFEHLLPSKAK